MLPKSFEIDFAEIKTQLELLGGLVEKAVWDSLAALRSKNIEMSRHIIERDWEIYKKRYFIQEKVSVLIIRRQPNEPDFHAAFSIFSIIDEMERIGDYAFRIALLNLLSKVSPGPETIIDLTQTALKATSMLRHALHAFLAEDFDLAIQFSKEDIKTDLLYKRAYDELMQIGITGTGRETDHSLSLRMG